VVRVSIPLSPYLPIFLFPIFVITNCYYNNMESVNIHTIWEQVQTFVQNRTSTELAIGGGFFALLLIFVPLVSRGQRRRRLRKFAPNIGLESFQISPLGRDAFFKIHNHGEVATLTSIFIRGRRDILFKNAFVGHELQRDKSYSILLEATAKERIENNFTIEISYLDQKSNVYKQAFDLNHKTAKQPKLVRAR